MSERYILDIKFEELKYQDEDDVIRYIKFAQCYENYLKKALAPDHLQQLKKVNNLKTEELATITGQIEDWKEVAVRGGKFIEFYTDPPTRFTFQTGEEYDKVLTAILAIGWKMSLQVE